MTAISRRKALTVAGAAAASAVAISGTAAIGVEHEPLVALWDRKCAMEREKEARIERISELEKQVDHDTIVTGVDFRDITPTDVSAAPEKRIRSFTDLNNTFSNYLRHISIGLRAKIINWDEYDPLLREILDRRKRLHTELTRQIKEWIDARTRLGIPELQDRDEKLFDDLWKLREQIASSQAVTLTGLAIQARLLRECTDEEDEPADIVAVKLAKAISDGLTARTGGAS